MDPKFKNRIDMRRRIVIAAIRDGCLDCPDQGLLCRDHSHVVIDIYRDPKKWLPIYEAQIFGPSPTTPQPTVTP